jgi:hypothetical protein
MLYSDLRHYRKKMWRCPTKKEPKWTFPQGWKEGVIKYIIEGVAHIPSHYNGKKGVEVTPGVLHFPVKHRVNVDTLPVLVWDLNDLIPVRIGNLQTAIIRELQPYCNSETYRARKATRRIGPRGHRGSRS